MAKAVLKYDLTDPDDRLEHLRAIKSTGMALVLWSFVHNSRKGLEYQIQENNYNAYALLDKIYERMSDELDRRGIVIDELVV